MPYTPHPSKYFQAPTDTATIWRYMDFAKFTSLLQSKHLWFAQAQSMWELDHLEGSTSQASIEKYKELRATLNFKVSGEESRHDTYINCWHCNEAESVAMWKIYTLQGQGVAIKSTLGQLKEAVKNDPNPIYISKVHYLDYANDIVQDHHENRLFPYLGKRDAFKYEEEVRAIIQLVRNQENMVFRADGKTDDDDLSGLSVKADLNALINKIIVSPFAPQWYVDVLQQLARSHELKKAPVQMSKLLQDTPLY